MNDLSHVTTEASMRFNLCAVRAVNTALGFVKYPTLAAFDSVLLAKKKEMSAYSKYMFLR